MTTPTLPDQLRALVDQVDVPSFAEVRTYATSMPSNAAAPRRRFVTALAAVLALVVTGAAALALVRGDRSSPRLVPAVTGGARRPPSACSVTTTTDLGCRMSPRRASSILGFEPRVPTGIPEGWVRVGSWLMVYRDHLPDGEQLPDGVEQAMVFRQVWGPPGTDLRVAQKRCPTLLAVRQRVLFPGESLTPPGATVDLEDGTMALGSLPEGTCTGVSQNFGHLMWTSDGLWFSLGSYAIAPDQVLAIARSIDR